MSISSDFLFSLRDVVLRLSMQTSCVLCE